MMALPGSPLPNTPYKHQSINNTNKMGQDFLPNINREQNFMNTSDILRQRLIRIKSNAFREDKDEVRTKHSTKELENIRNHLKDSPVERQKSFKTPTSESNRPKNTPLRGHHPNRCGTRHEHYTTVIVNTPTLICNAISLSCEKPSRSYLSSGPRDGATSFHNDDVTPKDNSNFSEQWQAQTRYQHQPSSKNFFSSLAQTSQRQTKDRQPNTLKLKDFYLMKESSLKHSQNFQSKQSMNKDLNDSSKRGTEPLTESKISPIKASGHVRSISGNLVQIKWPINQDSELYHIPASRFNSTVVGRESKKMMRSVSYLNSRKHSESREEFEQRFGEKSMYIDKTKGINLTETQRQHFNDQSPIRTNEVQEEKSIKAWRINCAGLSTNTEKFSERNEESNNARKQSENELGNIKQEFEDQKSKNQKQSPSRQILVSYKNKKGGIYINEQKVNFLRYLTTNGEIQKSESARSKEDFSQDVIRPLTKKI